ncbi:translation initiation factor IF-2-like [Bubalus kerabau]|uniref:translation initiation factor IF-2-like n=1 Tax=Bubalus bubalis TaxID=89462 RepID=UPI000DBC8693|nr:translation initiation factor IF-2-like [Bubalus bubalis]XP_055390699.1 translation initiation factor IF-2-like [Bubalus carabanensis]
MGTNPRTPRYRAGEKQGRCAAPAFSPFLRPPHPRSGDQLFSTINTHGSTSGSLNYTYCRRPGSGLLLTSNYAKGGDSLGPDHKSAQLREGGWSADPESRRWGPSSAPRPDPGPRLYTAEPGRGLRAGPPGRAAAPPRPSARAAAGLTRGGGAEPAGRPRPDPRRAAPPPRPKRSRAAEAARAGRGVAQEAGGVPVCAGRKRGARPAEGGRPRGAGQKGRAARRRPPPRRHSPAPPTSATSGSEGRWWPCRAEEGAGAPRGGTRGTQASLPRPLPPHGQPDAANPGAPASAPPSSAFVQPPPLSAPAERASWGPCSGARPRGHLRAAAARRLERGRVT